MSEPMKCFANTYTLSPSLRFTFLEISILLDLQKKNAIFQIILHN